MTLKELFLDEVKEGDKVAVSVSGRQEPVIGILDALDDNLCRIQTKNGSPRIALDSITSYDILEEYNEIESETETFPILNQQLVDNKTVNTFSRPEPIEQLTDVLESPPPGDFESVDWDGICKSLTDEAISTELKQNINNICSSFGFIQSRFNQLHQNDLDEKLHNLRARILKLCKEYPDSSWALYRMIAAMYFITQRYEDSLKYFIS